MATKPGILARGPWDPSDVTVRWREDAYEASAAETQRADAAIQALNDRDSPSHDGLAARMSGWGDTGGGIELELQPMRWSLRLDEGDALQSISVQCVVRDGAGRWLAGRRADWVATWAGRWALGAGGAVEVGENPAETLTRELHEEWGLTPERETIEALVLLPNHMVMLIGQVWVADGAPIVRDPEHDDHAWWPADPQDWPQEAHPALRGLAALLS
jgi:8-oxo-dGTP diphosphatase